MPRGGYREGAGRKSVGGKSRQDYKIRVSDDEKDLVNRILAISRQSEARHKELENVVMMLEKEGGADEADRPNTSKG